MYTTTLALALAPLFYVASADVSLDRDDVPRECDFICDPIVDLSRACDTDIRGARDRDEDRLEAQCFCTNDSFDVARVAALCADCIRQNWRSDDDDDDDDEDEDRRDDMEDIEDILYTCGFASTTFNAASASSIVSGVTASADRPTDTAQLTTTIVGGQTASNTRGQTSATGSSGDDNNNNNNNNNDDDNNNSNTNNDDPTTTDDAANADETNAAGAIAPYGVAGLVVAGAFMMLA